MPRNTYEIRSLISFPEALLRRAFILFSFFYLTVAYDLRIRPSNVIIADISFTSPQTSTHNQRQDKALQNAGDHCKVVFHSSSILVSLQTAVSTGYYLRIAGSSQLGEDPHDVFKNFHALFQRCVAGMVAGCH